MERESGWKNSMERLPWSSKNIPSQLSMLHCSFKHALILPPLPLPLSLSSSSSALVPDRMSCRGTARFDSVRGWHCGSALSRAPHEPRAHVVQHPNVRESGRKVDTLLLDTIGVKDQVKDYQRNHQHPHQRKKYRRYQERGASVEKPRDVPNRLCCRQSKWHPNVENPRKMRGKGRKDVFPFWDCAK